MAKPSRLDTVEQLEITDRKQWRAWLKKNHKRPEGVWLITWKKHTADHVSYDETIEEALCFGWIDSLPRKLDADRRMLYFCPRKPKSVWSKLNKERIEKLIANGSMTKAGLVKIEAARADGSWATLDAVDAMVIPPDLKKALAKNRMAKKHFDAFPPGRKKFLLYWISSAKTDGTRTTRIEKTIEIAEKNIRSNGPVK
jgi:uncharacterized protein YdeI (YjbR/CyaY-like superfamily)